MQISETETPLHRLETVYRRLTERLSTADTPQGALRNIIDGWFFTLEEDVLAEGAIDAGDEEKLIGKTNELLKQRLTKITSTAPMFSAHCGAIAKRRLRATRPSPTAFWHGSQGSPMWLRARSGMPASKGRSTILVR